MAEAGKDTIYVDIDDEITGIIDKVSNAKQKIVALVLPKRATVFQSIVNMKLLKKSGDIHKKKLVLITSEASILPLAGAVQLHVAKTLQSKPAIPHAPNAVPDDVEIGDEDTIAELAEDDPSAEEDLIDEDPELDTAKAVGVLAGAKALSNTSEASAAASSADDVIEIDNQATGATEAAAGAAKKSKKAKKAGGKDKLKIPNFEKFRKRFLLIGAGFIALLIFIIFATMVLPKAKITIKTDSVSTDTTLDFTASAAGSSFDEETSVVVAEKAEVIKTDTEKVPATGKKNVGKKASGTVSLELIDCSQNTTTLPAGTGVSSNGMTYLTQTSVTFTRLQLGSECRNDLAPAFTTATVNVVAKEAGDEYNINGGRDFNVAGFSNVEGVDSSEMAGGTTKEITVVSAGDVASAKEKLKDKSKAAATEELTEELESKDLLAVTESFTAANTAVTVSPNVGAESTEVTVTNAVTYTMFGVNRGNLKTLVVKEAEKDIDTSKQAIGNDGLDKATFKVIDRPTPDDIKLSVSTTVSTGAQFDEAELKKELFGKKKGQVELLLEPRPSVQDVEVSFNPFWVYTVPSKESRIEIVIEQVK